MDKPNSGTQNSCNALKILSQYTHEKLVMITTITVIMITITIIIISIIIITKAFISTTSTTSTIIIIVILPRIMKITIIQLN